MGFLRTAHALHMLWHCTCSTCCSTCMVHMYMQDGLSLSGRLQDALWCAHAHTPPYQHQCTHMMRNSNAPATPITPQPQTGTLHTQSNSHSQSTTHSSGQRRLSMQVRMAALRCTPRSIGVCLVVAYCLQAASNAASSDIVGVGWLCVVVMQMTWNGKTKHSKNNDV